MLAFALVKQLLVQLLEHLADVHGEPVHGGVPVARRVLFERRQHDRQQHVPLLRHQVDNVLVVPQEERAFRDLKVWTDLVDGCVDGTGRSRGQRGKRHEPRVWTGRFSWGMRSESTLGVHTSWDRYGHELQARTGNQGHAASRLVRPTQA
eukprot:366007-Chlamydomonas_euryale.AAC.4